MNGMAGENDSARMMPLGPSNGNSFARRLLGRRCRHGVRVVSVVGVAVLAAALFALRLASTGLPQPWVDRLCRSLSTEDSVVEMERVRFSTATLRLSIGSARVFPRGVVSDPIVAVSGASVRFRPRPCRPNASWIRSIHFDGVYVAVPDTDGDSSFGESAGLYSPDADFPPIRVECREAEIYALEMHDLHGFLSCRAGKVRFSGAEVRFDGPSEAPQSVKLDCEIDTNEFGVDASASGHLNPEKLIPLFEAIDSPGAVGEISAFGFPARPPKIMDFKLRYFPERGERRVSMFIEAGASTYEGVQLSGFSGNLSIGSNGNGWSSIRVKNLLVKRPEGTASADLDIDTSARRLAVSASSTLDPMRTLRMISVLDDDETDGVHFMPGVIAKVDGVYAWRGENRTNTCLRISLFSPEMTTHGITFTDASASGFYETNTLRMASFKAHSFGGETGASARIDFGMDTNDVPRVGFDMEFENLSQNGLLALGGVAAAQEDGRVKGRISFEGPVADVFSGAFKETAGSLALDVEDGHVYRVPLFSGMTDVLADFIPGVDWLTDQNSLMARADLSDGKLHFGKLRIEGAVVSIYGRGDIATDGALDLTLKASLLNEKTWVGKGVHYLLSPVSSIFGIKATGTLSEPKWSSAALSALGL